MTNIRPLRNRAFSMLTVAQAANRAPADHVEFDGASADILGPLITLSTGAGQLSGIFVLQPATYKITAHLGVTLTAGTDAALLRLTTSPAGVAIVPTSAGDPVFDGHASAFAGFGVGVTPIEVIFAPVAVATIELRIISVTGTIVTIDTGSEILIEQIVT